MTTSSSIDTSTLRGSRHPGPPLVLPAISYTVLFAAGLAFLFSMASMPYAPPFASENAILEYFRSNPTGVRLNGFFQLAASIPLGIFTAVAVSRLQFLGVRAAGLTIALFGGIGASLFLAICGLVQYVMSQPEALADAAVLRSLQELSFAIGGAGHIALTGLLLAGISIPSWFHGFLPRRICIFGIVLAVLSEVSILSLIFPAFTLLLLVRFPSFVWMILCGITLARYRLKNPSVSMSQAA